MRGRIAFRGRLDFCSNFYLKGMFLDGLFFRTREHAFQWGKFTNEHWKVKEEVRAQPSPYDAKSVARAYKHYYREDWEKGYSIEWMEKVVYEFFRQHLGMRDKLLSTMQEHLEEENNWGDMFWGTVNGKGRNELGKCLMRVRDRFRGSV